MGPPLDAAVTSRWLLARSAECLRVCPLLVCAMLNACHSDKGVSPVVTEAPRRVHVPDEKAATGSAGAPSPVHALGTRTFLVGDRGREIIARSVAGQTRVVVPQAAWWLYDEDRGLLWTLYDGALSVVDLRTELPPIPLATGLTGAGGIWVEWPAARASQYVREETGCEATSDAVEVKMRSNPALRLVATDERRSFLAAGLRWLRAQTRRAASSRSAGSRPRAPGFPSDAHQVTLPKQWAGCDEVERCGRAVSFGSSRLQLVLVGDKFGADCWQRSCLLFNPDTKAFASPPVIADVKTGELSTAPLPMRWSAASDARPGVCGPYYFDVSGTAFLVGSFFCTVDGECQALGGEGIGWLEPGAVVGEPG